jgi:hypothetical protein
MAAPTPFFRPPPGSPEQGSTRNSSPVAPAPLGRLGPRHQRRRPPQKRKEEVGKKWSVPLPYSFLVTARLSRPLRAPRIGLLSYLGHRGAQPQAVLSVPVGDALVPSKRNGLAFCRRLLSSVAGDEADSMLFRGKPEATGGTPVPPWRIPARGLSVCRSHGLALAECPVFRGLQGMAGCGSGLSFNDPNPRRTKEGRQLVQVCLFAPAVRNAGFSRS